MSYLKTVCFVCLLSLCVGSQYTYASSVAFNQTQFDKIKQQYQGQPWLMLLWSVDCPPCFKELAIMQKLLAKHDDLAIVIINADADEGVMAQRKHIIKKFALTQFNIYHFADGQADQSRFLIDPAWYGELPRSYFVESNGTFHGKSGLVQESMVTQWLVKQPIK
ncbi:hypothetical protein NBRC116592_22540 [Colwellia sp. KU-HH00111]|uniref:TlpA family protein disulfide reductase n=1 Tax=Colwellia sp. KU-HH00111 TaxID=3127652 RepID=UPI0031088328